MLTIVIGIGRNVGHAPMDAQRWALFQGAVLGIARGSGRVVFAGTGTGAYDGAVEESFTAMVHASDEADLGTLRRQLAGLARRFGQESIALTVGNGSHVGGEPIPAAVARSNGHAQPSFSLTQHDASE